MSTLSFLRNLSGPGWLYWKAVKQPNPETPMYESRTLDEIERMGQQALVSYMKEVENSAIIFKELEKARAASFAALLISILCLAELVFFTWLVVKTL